MKLASFTLSMYNASAWFSYLIPVPKIKRKEKVSKKYEHILEL